MTGAEGTKPNQSAVVLPTTPAGIQAKWFLSAWADQPIPAGQITQHFDAGFLTEVTPAKLNQVLAPLGPPELVGIRLSQPESVIAVVSTSEGTQEWTVTLSVDGQGLIGGLLISPATKLPPSPTTWTGVDTALRSVAPEVRLLVANVTGGSCQAVHSIDPTTPAPLGSMFKLYVLDALARAIGSGQIGWNQNLTVTSQVKSLPSGTLQDDPDGTQVSVEAAAAKMISISDNTAANMLISRLGRSAVEAALAATHMSNPSLDTPFLTTRELFILKLVDYPARAERYAAADQAGRAALLASTIDPTPLPTLTQAADWVAPRDIDAIEWFASAQDICNAYLSLASLATQPGMEPLGGVLEINDGGLGLDPNQWTKTWFKGGSEPGVLTLSYLATTTTGQTYVVVALAENPNAAIDETTAAPKMLSAIKGALTLAAKG